MHIDNFKVEEGASATGDEISASHSFLFYPNPLSGSKLYLKSQPEWKGNEMTIQIADPEGRVVHLQKLSKADLEKGMDVQVAGRNVFHSVGDKPK
jgi:hypothetical protein